MKLFVPSHAPNVIDAVTLFMNAKLARFQFKCVLLFPPFSFE